MANQEILQIAVPVVNGADDVQNQMGTLWQRPAHYAVSTNEIATIKSSNPDEFGIAVPHIHFGYGGFSFLFI